MEGCTYPYKDGKREWVDDEEFKRRGEQARNEYAAIVALSFYNEVIRDNPQLRHACTHRYYLNDTIDAWKMEPEEVGNPPRYAARSNIMHQLHRQWHMIASFTTEMIVWKVDAKCSANEEPMTFDEMLESSLWLGDS